MVICLHQLQIRSIVHNYRAPPYHSPKSHSCLFSSVGLCHGTDRHTQMAVANIHFTSTTVNAKCNRAFERSLSLGLKVVHDGKCSCSVLIHFFSFSCQISVYLIYTKDRMRLTVKGEAAEQRREVSNEVDALRPKCILFNGKYSPFPSIVWCFCHNVYDGFRQLFSCLYSTLCQQLIAVMCFVCLMITLICHVSYSFKLICMVLQVMVTVFFVCYGNHSQPKVACWLTDWPFTQVSSTLKHDFLYVDLPVLSSVLWHCCLHDLKGTCGIKSCSNCPQAFCYGQFVIPTVKFCIKQYKTPWPCPATPCILI